MFYKGVLGWGLCIPEAATFMFRCQLQQEQITSWALNILVLTSFYTALGRSRTNYSSFQLQRFTLFSMYPSSRKQLDCLHLCQLALHFLIHRVFIKLLLRSWIAVWSRVMAIRCPRYVYAGHSLMTHFLHGMMKMHFKRGCQWLTSQIDN